MNAAVRLSSEEAQDDRGPRRAKAAKVWRPPYNVTRSGAKRRRWTTPDPVSIIIFLLLVSATAFVTQIYFELFGTRICQKRANWIVGSVH
jgi:hypothetical protein